MKTNKNQSFKFCMMALASGLFIMISSCTADQITTQDDALSIAAPTNLMVSVNGPSVNGQGTLSFDGIPIAGEGFRHFTFHAMMKKDGSAQGSGILTYTGGVRNIAFKINCLNIDGNRAIMTGVTTRDNQFPGNEGLLFWFEVYDNGEGSNADPDRMSLYFQGGDPNTYNCANQFTVDIYDIEGGNIQVKG